MFERLLKDTRVPIILMGLIVVIALAYVINLVKAFKLPQSGMSSLQVAIHTPTSTPLSSWHLLGVHQDEPPVLPQTQLQLTLEGVMLSPHDQQHSYAIIDSPSVAAKVYHVGSTLPGSAILESIHEEQVTLKFQGQLQSLKLPHQGVSPS